MGIPYRVQSSSDARVRRCRSLLSSNGILSTVQFWKTHLVRLPDMPLSLSMRVGLDLSSAHFGEVS